MRREVVPVTTTQPRVTDYARDRLGPGVVLVGGFFRMCVLTGKALFRVPFQWREFIMQCWFIMRVALLPTMAVSVPVTALYSEEDGVVDWRECLQDEHPGSKNVRVSGAHATVGSNPAALAAIAEALSL